MSALLQFALPAQCVCLYGFVFVYCARKNSVIDTESVAAASEFRGPKTEARFLFGLLLERLLLLLLLLW